MCVCVCVCVCVCHSEVSSAPPEEDSEADVFQPVRCNVAFGSGYDGWAFRLDQFANMYAEKLACK